MKKIVLLWLFAWMAWNGYAQEDRVESSVRMDTIHIDYRTQYVSSFWDNFYIQGSFAGRLLCAEEDNHLSVGKRLAPGFLFGIGKQLYPDVGIRLSFGGLRLNGWNTGELGVHKLEADWTQDRDPVREYYESQGIETSGGYKQKLRYFELNADVMFDLYNIFTKNNRLENRWEFEGYTGLGYLHTKSWRGISKNDKVAFRLGLIAGYNITSRLGINLEIGSSITGATFDSEIGKGNKFDTFFSGLIGLKWRIGKQGFNVVRLIPSEQYQALNNSVSLIRREVIEKAAVQEVITHTGEIGSLLIPIVTFLPQKSDYNEELQQVNIYEVAQFMEENPEMKITIIGNINGSDIKIARKRAERVKDVLVGKYGIEATRLNIRVKDMSEVSRVAVNSQTVHFVIDNE